MGFSIPTRTALSEQAPVSVAGSDRLGDQPLVSGTLEVRLAAGPEDVLAAKQLRYRVFYDEMGATPSPAARDSRLDEDSFDDVADHLLVLDHQLGDGPEAVVGTYRLIRRSAAGTAGGFYTADEFDISRLVAQPGEILELGRSCTAAGYRTRPTMQLLWKGIAAYVFQNDISLMFGCASLPGNDAEALRTQLAYLYHQHLAPERIRATALPERYLEMDRMPVEEIDLRRTAAALPPLIKGYLRLGGYVGHGAVVDHQFNTTDVCVIVETSNVSDKYYKHYEREARGVSIQ
ncbi:GNAT family N-acetyltransferase [Nisaea acidiphila]|uniref:L-ornithine N(alpha)-acyltransferase n=1 Tax=Nisaea acidiphila TaxID=1862145 RepID=A0A9J7AXX1_9PROT|nr:GNAT family N-acyltransferase [Nisaea acidiphila]UUX52128.1 GNAT family N-acetyltransferase [Nisaea acidiphila]